MSGGRIIDGDGHIFEDIAGIERHMPEAFRKQHRVPVPIIPSLDHMHGPMIKLQAGAFGGGKMIGQPEWKEFMEDVGIESAVLYPTSALAYGVITDIDWSVCLARAYNEWLHEAYVAKGDIFKGMALIPMVDPDAAVAELRYAIRELGMTGAMIPSNGLQATLGSKKYWPVYQEAESLGCSLALHGGSHHNMGMDDFTTFAPVHALGHPFGMMINLASMVFNGVFDRFPNLRVGYLEAGVAWFLFCLERFDGSWAAFQPFDFADQLVKTRPGEKMSKYIKRLIENDRLFIGCEGDEPTLGYAVKVVGSKTFIYSSDFPHEVTAESCKEEIQELRENPELSDDDKSNILFRNAERFYQARVPVA